MRSELFRGTTLGLLISSLCLNGTNVVAQQPESSHYQSAFARPLPIDRGSAALSQSLKKLHTRASLAMVVAHPDDEDGGMLTYEGRGQGVDTTLLTLNRGEGGQNDMTSDYWDELGTLRTQELLAAGNYYGVHQYFTRVADFGFSKTIEEALKTWGKDRVLYDVVRVIRMQRPLVITSTFVGNVSDGHGHHQVSGAMAQEAYKAAGDPNMFPDQIKAGLLPWTPLKVYGRVPFARISDKGVYDYATGHWEPVRFRNYADDTWIEGVPSTNVEIPTGTYNPLLGSSYMQISREGLNEQKSQNGGIAIPLPRSTSSPYHLYAARISTSPHESSFFDGIDITLAGIASYAPEAQQAPWREKLNALNATVESAIKDFNAATPSTIAPTLAKGLAQTNALLDEVNKSNLPAESRYNMAHELQIKQAQFNEALKQSLGLSFLANTADGAGPQRSGPFGDMSIQTPTSQNVIPGQTFNVSVHIANQGSEPVSLTDVQVKSEAGPGWIMTPKDSITGAMAPSDSRDQLIAITVPKDAELTKPYFSRPNLEQSYYDISDLRYLNLPNRPYPLLAEATVAYQGVNIKLTGVVQTIHRMNGDGPVLEPLLVAPAISLTVSPLAGIVPLMSTTFELHVTLHSSVKGPAKGQVHLDLPKGWMSTPAVADFATTREGEDQNLVFRVQPESVQPKPYTITAVAEYNGEKYTQGFETVGYAGLRPYPHYRPATYRTSGVDVKTAPNLKVGYIMGTGDDVAMSLEDMGIHPIFLSAQDIATGDLSQYDAIVLGIRAYAARPELKTFNNRLLEYAKGGGTVIVQYQTQEFDHNYGPYPLSLSGDPEKVIEEDNKVSLLDPKDPVFNWPNKITTADFDNWVEERGHGFMRTWDPHYVALTEMHDAGQDPQKGGLLYTRYGKGAYVYLAYAFFRQMPDGVPGSYRIMANLLSMGKNPGLTTTPSNH
ncbi:GlcNAc-PI de-N-acetylase [Edaphobacter aggregans]|uniref:GlcNAc-PI de-N-acetylase n=1 Tax=Edaphobacter aggregans TaxID=570835 RepID=A0A428MLK6_9BACT|nr:PIG-L family deacetylase [Edaphobacter aggregans]RSL17746.1 GlcNAc-PI de-N-acetylase [Edaphobacter aggregans]